MAARATGSWQRPSANGGAGEPGTPPLASKSLRMQVLIIDNGDSFTFNLSQLVSKLTGCRPIVIPNDESRWRDVVRREPVGAIIISPGPGSPAKTADFGVCPEVIRESDLPLLGVCLGCQGIGHAYGAAVVPAPEPFHGRISRVSHYGDELFAGIAEVFDAVRYHSLCVDGGTLPDCLEVTARTEDGTIMALRHRERPQFGVQFHPESVSAEQGEQLVRNFLAAVPTRQKARNAETPKRRLRARDGNPSRVVYRRLDRWTEPQVAFERLFLDSRDAFWLDSAALVPGFSRFSMMGDTSSPTCSVLRYSTARRTLRVARDGVLEHRRVDGLLPALRERLDRPVERAESLPFDFQTGLVGFFGYELRNECNSPTTRKSRYPDAVLFEVDRCVVFDHAVRCVYLVRLVEAGDPSDDAWFDRVEADLVAPQSAAAPPSSNRHPLVARPLDDSASYARKVRSCKAELGAGESYQICLSSEFEADFDAPPYAVYAALRAINPAPYGSFLRSGDLAIASSSPERFLQVTSQRSMCAKPIKGTSARGNDPHEDSLLATWLRSDEKSRAENLMIVDLLRNDVGRVAVTGSVQVPVLMDVEPYPTVHQLVSTVTGTLRSDLDCIDALASAFPGGSMTGAPKLRTMSIIDRLEQRPRGVYSGAIGYLSHGDRMDLAIVIRTIIMQGSRATVGSGGGIVAMSDPQAEFEEMMLKAQAPLKALAAASAGSADDLEIR